MANYYKLVKIRKKYGAIFDEDGNQVDEEERGLDEQCVAKLPKSGTHEWILLPKESGQKQYLRCANCGNVSHF